MSSQSKPSTSLNQTSNSDDSIDWNKASISPEKASPEDFVPINGSNSLTPILQEVCPGNPQNEKDCNEIPNSLWIANPQGSSTQGVCNCCLTNGTSFADSEKVSPGQNPCTECPANAFCGDGNGFCNGSTGNSKVSCVQNSSTLQWSPNCSSATQCGGLCKAGCGVGEYLAFQQCVKPNGVDTYKCQFRITQWKSWLVYGGILILIILILIIYFYTRRSYRPQPIQPIQPVQQVATQQIIPNRSQRYGQTIEVPGFQESIITNPRRSQYGLASSTV